MQQKCFLFWDKLVHQKLYINEEYHCKHTVTTWMATFCGHTFGNYISIVDSYLLVMFGTGSGNSSAIPRNIFVFNYWSQTMKFLFWEHKVMPKLWTGPILSGMIRTLNLFSLCFKHDMVFPINLQVSSMQKRAYITCQMDFGCVL